MSIKFKIAETESFTKKIYKSEYKNLYKKIKEYAYPLLKRNPFFGPNIKILKGNYSDFYRFRIGDYWLFCTVNKQEIIVFIIDIMHIKNAYK